jgi:hypothetical protein
MPAKRVLREPTPAEVRRMDAEAEAFGPIVRRWSDLELTARLTACLKELAWRDGEEAAAAWCEHWGGRLRAFFDESGADAD